MTDFTDDFVNLVQENDPYKTATDLRDLVTTGTWLNEVTQTQLLIELLYRQLKDAIPQDPPANEVQ